MSLSVLGLRCEGELWSSEHGRPVVTTDPDPRERDTSSLAQHSTGLLLENQPAAPLGARPGVLLNLSVLEVGWRELDGSHRRRAAGTPVSRGLLHPHGWCLGPGGWSVKRLSWASLSQGLVHVASPGFLTAWRTQASQTSMVTGFSQSRRCQRPEVEGCAWSRVTPTEFVLVLGHPPPTHSRE